MKKIAITGASGFTGRVLMEILRETNGNLLPLVHRSSGLLHEIEMDLADPSIVKILDQLPPVDVVVHLGARIGWKSVEPLQLFRSNIVATGELACWAAKNDAYFIYISAALIAGETKMVITQADPPKTQNDYLRSKWLGEEMIKMSGARYCILRSAGIFGYKGPTHLGINEAIDGAINGKLPELSVDPKIKRNYIYVRDLCQTIAYCIESQLTGTFLASGSSVETMGNMLQKICNVFLPGQKPEIQTFSGGADQVIVHSPELPGGRDFEDALEDIRLVVKKTE